jgi:hypothetical protein
MNLRMLARSAGGFATCLVLRVDPDGTLTIANAGHLAPYRNKAEFPLENRLPLGLDANTVYAESTSHLDKGEQLTLLTDGVVEARGKNGELFGFERTSAVATDPAESIARAAQDFGQEDDITVAITSIVSLSSIRLPRPARYFCTTDRCRQTLQSCRSSSRCSQPSIPIINADVVRTVLWSSELQSIAISPTESRSLVWC